MQSKNINYFSILFSLLIFVLSQNSFAFLGDSLNIPPHADYKTIESDNFNIVFPEIYTQEAKKIIPILENSHQKLTKVFDYTPKRKVTVILADHMDSANGATSAVGHQGFVLYLTAPDPYSSLGEYKNWLETLIIHEYAHFLTLDQTRGIFQFLRYLWGDLILPNHFWPSWLAEGLAVYAESHYAPYGRGEGTYYRTLLRDSIAKNVLGTRDFLQYAQVFGPIPKFPFGESYYFAGYGIIDQMVSELGVKSLAAYPETSSWRVPFFLNGGLENIGGNSFDSLYYNWINRKKSEMSSEIAKINPSHAPSLDFLSDPSKSALGVRLSPDETKAAYIMSGSGEERTAIHIKDLVTKHVKVYEFANSGATLAWKDNHNLLFTKEDFYGPYLFYSDLYIADLEQSSTIRLTRGERAKDIDYCKTKDGHEYAVYVYHKGKDAQLRRIDLATRSIKTIYKAPEYHQISNPRCDNNRSSETTVYFSEHENSVFEVIYKISLETNGNSKPIRLFGGEADQFRALFPEPVEDGTVLFTKVKSGFFELALWNPNTKKVSTIAKNTGGYWLPSVSANKLAVTYVSASGIQAAITDRSWITNSKSTPKEPNDVSKKSTLVSSSEISDNKSFEISNYKFYKSIAPRFWSPYLTLEEDHYEFGGLIGGWDDLDQFEYQLAAWYDTLAKHPGGYGNTKHRFYGYRLGLSASSYLSEYIIYADGNKKFFEDRVLSLSLSRPFPSAFWTIEPGIFIAWGRTYKGGDFGAQAYPPDERLGFSLVYDNIQQYAYSLMPQEGSLAKLYSVRLISNEEKSWKHLLNFNQLFSFYPRHSSLSFNLFGGLTQGESGRMPISYIKVGGRGTLSDLDLPLRGYPLGRFYTNRALVLQSEYRIPALQLFHGLGTFPLFFKNLGFYGFHDFGYVHLDSADEYGSKTFHSLGGGAVLNTVIGYNAPLQLRLEVAKGLDSAAGGQWSYSLLVGN